MKSTVVQLKNRGFASSDLNVSFSDKSFEELIQLLESPVAVERTLSARLLARIINPEAIKHLCIVLQKEKKLYTKIEISNSLASYGILAVPYLIDLLGRIGTNQHRIADKVIFNKNSYPLPRDIASRTLIRIGNCALPALINLLSSENL